MRTHDGGEGDGGFEGVEEDECRLGREDGAREEQVCAQRGQICTDTRYER